MAVAGREEPFMPDLSLNSLERSATEGLLITSYRDLVSCPGRGLAEVNTRNGVLILTDDYRQPSAIKLTVRGSEL
jgi:hypothetical protein